MEQKNRRERRTKIQLEQDMMDAIERLVCEKGFSNIPLLEFTHEANIDPNVFYRRYKTVEDIYSELSKKYDFWINDSIDVNQLHTLGDKAFFANGIKMLHRTLQANPVMQKILLWELTEINETTKHSAQTRDTMNSNLVLYYKRLFELINFEITPVLAILIAGVYYLTLRRGIATFCLIDFSSEQGKEKLDAAIDTITEMVFAQIEHRNRQVTMAKEMDKDGILHENICKYMGLSTKELKSLLK